ncbi:hypothetical protein GCM10023116_03270 [Kistimonas scapharcae]|uniref:Uncharacterized protein n=1 Tax=Kistimonas scapharcae TaxID=1036133 RepID=A0ABP8UVX4_9GAMM
MSWGDNYVDKHRHTPGKYLYRWHLAPHTLIQAAPVMDIHLVRMLNLFTACLTKQCTIISLTASTRRDFKNVEIL